MANLRNEFEFRSALLTALGQEHTEAEAKNEEMWRRKMLDGLGVEYNQNDVNQFGLFREKLIEGVTNYSGGGGSSDFSTAEVTVNIEPPARECELYYVEIIDSEEYAGVTPVRSYISGKILMPLYKGSCDMLIRGDIPSTVATTGNVTYEAFPSENTGYFTITGDCTITIS